jgi:hypothetical protein
VTSPATRPPARALLTGLLAASLALAACSGDPEPKGARANASASPPASESSTPPPPPEPSLLSGRMGVTDGPVFAVKIDNTAKAHPQAGLSKADVVYVEQVEGGVTRLAAIYSSRYPKYVGPVRSARVTDIDLLRQYGTVGLIYSGSSNRLADNLRAAKLKLVSYDQDHTGYDRANNRTMPYDVIGTFDRLRQRAGKVDKPRAPGYSFGDAPAGGRNAKTFTVNYPMARVSGTWAPKKKAYQLSMDGVPAMAAEGGRLTTSTFVVQFVTVRPSVYHDVNGANTPLTETVGKGKALFFRDGQVYEGGWERAKPWSPTRYTIAGQEAVLAPGELWVALLGKDRKVSIG